MLQRTSTNATRRGAVAVYVAVAAPVLIAVVALAIDAGLLFDTKRSGQGCADAAALAGAGELFKTYTNEAFDDDGKDPGGTIRAHVLAVAAANGYANDGTSSV